jgi:hypothetical protein
MMVFAVICTLATATWIGYCLGRRAGSTPLTWKKRTSRIALGRLVINLLVLVTARRVRRTIGPRRAFSDVLGIWGLKTIAPLELLRGGVAWMRSY